MEIAMVDADVAEDFAFEFTALPQERQKRLVLGISVEHWEHVCISDYQDTWDPGLEASRSCPAPAPANSLCRLVFETAADWWLPSSRTCKYSLQVASS